MGDPRKLSTQPFAKPEKGKRIEINQKDRCNALILIGLRDRRAALNVVYMWLVSRFESLQCGLTYGGWGPVCSQAAEDPRHYPVQVT
jgi:hypothetical protein